MSFSSGQTLTKSSDLKSSAACCSGAPHPVIAKIFERIPHEVMSKFYGCGAPLPLGVDGFLLPSFFLSFALFL